MNVPPTLWSKVSIEELTAAINSSPSSAGITTGQLRWAAYVGSWNQTASSSQSREISSSACAGVESGWSRSMSATGFPASSGLRPVTGPLTRRTWSVRCPSPWARLSV